MQLLTVITAQDVYNGSMLCIFSRTDHRCGLIEHDIQSLLRLEAATVKRNVGELIDLLGNIPRRFAVYQHPPLREN